MKIHTCRDSTCVFLWSRRISMTLRNLPFFKEVIGGFLQIVFSKGWFCIWLQCSISIYFKCRTAGWFAYISVKKAVLTKTSTYTRCMSTALVVLLFTLFLVNTKFDSFKLLKGEPVVPHTSCRKSNEGSGRVRGRGRFNGVSSKDKKQERKGIGKFIEKRKTNKQLFKKEIVFRFRIAER